MWAKEVGPSEAAVTIFVLNGGPGKPHTELDGIFSAWPEFRFIYWDSLGSHGSDCFNETEACTWQPHNWATLDDFVAQAQAVADHFMLVPESTILLAHSFGVVLALELAARAKQGDQYLGLVLSDWVASQALVTSWSKKTPCQMLLPDKSGIKPGCSYINTRQTPPAYVAYTFGSDNPGPLGEFVWGKNGWMESWDRSKDLPSILSPALWIVGDHDLVSPEDVEANAKRMPRSAFAKLSGAGHNSFADKPSQWIHEVSEWLHTETALRQQKTANFASGTRWISQKYSKIAISAAARSEIVGFLHIAISFVFLAACIAFAIRHGQLTCCNFRTGSHHFGSLLCESESDA